MSTKTTLQELTTSQQPSVGSIYCIAIDGHGGSGKSTLATFLSEKLNAQILHTDDFASWDNPSQWWQSVIKYVFEPLEHGATTLNYPRSSWWENHNPEPVIDQVVTQILILEGVGSLRQEFRTYISYGIFIETPLEICLQRGIERDKKTGKSVAELTRLWKAWFEAEDTYFTRDNPKAVADIIINGTIPWSKQIDL